MANIASAKSYWHPKALGDFESSASFREIGLVDRLIFTSADQTVAELRLIIGQALLAPYGSRRLLLIKQADQLSDVMQNTLLKLLEEPPLQLTVVLEGENSDRLLATVRSRLHQLPLEDSHLITASSPNEPPSWLANATLAHGYLSALKNRLEATAIFSELLVCYRQELIADPNPEKAAKLDLILRTLRRLDQNLNYKIVTEAFLLHWFDE